MMARSGVLAARGAARLVALAGVWGVGVLALLLGGGAIAAPARAQGAGCGVPRDLGTLPGGDFSRAYGISADGSVVVGWADDADNRGRAFRWTAAGGIQDLGVLPGTTESRATGISADGSTIVGHSGTPGVGNSNRACRWILAAGGEGWEAHSLGTLPGAADSYATASSADGSVVVGFAVIPLGGTLIRTRAFRWTAAGGMADLGTLPGFDSSSAQSVSGDGAVVAGYADVRIGVFTSVRGIRWTAAGGMESLGVEGDAHGVSGDGATVVGDAAGGAFRWTAEAGLRTIGPPGSFAAAVSASGSIVVGGTPSSFGQVPFRWTTAGGMLLILDRPPNGSTWVARGVSADGEWVVGSGSLSSGGERAILWRRPVCRADADCSGLVSVQDVFEFLAAYFVEGVAADFNQDTVVSLQDIFEFLAAYFAGC